MSRICKKCLIGQQAEDYQKLIERNRAAMPQKSRASDEVFDRRIAVCEDCDRLTGATCMECGCFVELRALRINASCPLKKWK